MWFEPERLRKNSKIWREHPEWVLTNPHFDGLEHNNEEMHLYTEAEEVVPVAHHQVQPTIHLTPSTHSHQMVDEEYVEEALSLEDMERKAIKTALERHRGRRRDAARELNISERTLYRKIKEYGIE